MLPLSAPGGGRKRPLKREALVYAFKVRSRLIRENKVARKRLPLEGKPFGSRIVGANRARGVEDVAPYSRGRRPLRE